MLIELNALASELPAVAEMTLQGLCGCLAMCGFPVDGTETLNGTTVLEIDVTANRGDALSHRGLARDLAARLGASLTPIPVEPLQTGEAMLPISLDTDDCLVYATAILTLDASAAGRVPDEAVAFLNAMGCSAKGMAPVDASNELLHRYGHPTHAFDADRITGAVCVRKAKKGEKFLALDGIERGLHPDDMVIADESGPIALAGHRGRSDQGHRDDQARIFGERVF